MKNLVNLVTFYLIATLTFASVELESAGEPEMIQATARSDDIIQFLLGSCIDDGDTCSSAGDCCNNCCILTVCSAETFCTGCTPTSRLSSCDNNDDCCSGCCSSGQCQDEDVCFPLGLAVWVIWLLCVSGGLCCIIIVIVVVMCVRKRRRETY